MKAYSLVWLLLLAVPLAAAEIATTDVVVKCEVEQFGVSAGLAGLALDGASGGGAMALSEDSMTAAAVKLPPGEYTLLLRTFAPAGDQDGFFVEIAGQRTRRTAPIGKWGVVAFPFSVKGNEPTTISIIGQEPGMLVDQVALVRGTYKDDEVDVLKLPASAQAGQVALTDVPRFRMPARLAALPKAPETPQAKHLDAPDGRLDMDARDLGSSTTGIIECWVKPRPAQRLWHDQGWHYFLHAAPATAGGLQIDLSRSPATNLRLTFSEGEKKESVDVSTTSAKLDEWHHLLVSWDFSGETQYLWLFFDGVGLCSRFPKTFTTPAFASLRFGNSPAGSDLPLLPMDGQIDELTVSRQSVAARLTK